MMMMISSVVHSMPWLLKAEPNSRIKKGKDVKYTIDDLQNEKVCSWDGVRNNEARKFMSSMKVGDMAFFYQSNCAEPGIVGTMRVVKEAHPDPTAADPTEPYYDPKNPEGKWVVVDFEYASHLVPPIPLFMIKSEARLQNMLLVKRSRLSVCPVTDNEWEVILQMHNERKLQAEPDLDESAAGLATKDRKRKLSAGPSSEKRSTASVQAGKESAPSGKPQRKSRRHDHGS